MELLAFFASDRAADVTGQNIRIVAASRRRGSISAIDTNVRIVRDTYER